MDRNNTMHAQAKKNTEDALSYLIVQAHAKSIELNQLGGTLMKHAQMELYVAQMENVEFEALSSTAQKLHSNPDLRIENRFVSQVYYIEKGNKTDIDGTSVKEGDIYVVAPEEETTAETDESSTSTAKSGENGKVITFVENYDDEAIEDDSMNDAIETESTTETETFEKAKPIAKSFDRLKPAYSGDIAKKIYKPSVMKPARELIKAIIDEQTQIALKNLINVATNNEKGTSSMHNSNSKGSLENYSVISSMYDAVIRGMDVAEMEISPLKDEAQKIAQLDTLAYTIISNAEEFRQENVEAFDSKNLTAGNVKQYYTALGKFESTKENKISGQEVIKNEFANDVANIMSR